MAANELIIIKSLCRQGISNDDIDLVNPEKSEPGQGLSVWFDTNEYSVFRIGIATFCKSDDCDEYSNVCI